MPHQPADPGKVVERCGLDGNKWDLTFDASSFITKELLMSNLIHFNDYRLSHKRNPKPRYSNHVQSSIDTLHRLRLQCDRIALERKLDRYNAVRTYYQRVRPSVYADRTPSHINCLVKKLQRKAEPAMVLHFPYRE